MPDDRLEIGSSFDPSGLTDGLDSATSAITEATGQMSLAFDSVSSSTMQMANTFTSAAIPATQQMNAAAAETAASWSKAATSIKESAESSQVAISGLSGGFAGMIGLLGGGLLVGVVNSVADLEIEIGHLSEKTGIAVTTLAGLNLMAKESGISWEAVSIGLVRMTRAQALAIEGMQMQVDAFKRIGISVQELKSLTPEELFERVSEAIKDTQAQGAIAAAIFPLMGRGAQAAIPLFKEYGDSILTVAQEHGKLTGITNDTVQAAENWKSTTEGLSAQLKSLLIPIVSGLTAVVRGLETAFMGLGFAVAQLQGVIQSNFKIINDAIHGNLTAAVQDTQVAGKAMVADWQNFTKQIEAIWNDKKFETPEASTEGLDDLAAEKAAKKRAEALKKAYQEVFGTPVSVQEESGIQTVVQPGLLADARAKMNAEIQKSDEKLNSELDKLFQEQLADRVKANKDAMASDKEVVDAALSELQDEVNAAKTTFEMKKSIIDQEAAEHKISQKQKTQDTLQALQDEIDAERSAMQDEIDILSAGDAQDVARAQKKQDELNNILREGQVKAEQIAAQGAQEQEKIQEKAFNQINSVINRSLVGYLQGTQTIGQALSKVWQSIALSAIESLEKMAAQEIEALLLHKAMAKENIMVDAKKAAADAYQALSGIPIVGPALGAAAAAAAFTAVMAFGSFDEGGLVGNQTMGAVLHPQEMVLPASLSLGLQNMIANSSGSTTASGAGGPTIQINAPLVGSVQAIDGKSFQDILLTNITPRVARDLQTRLKGYAVGQ